MGRRLRGSRMSASAMLVAVAVLLVAVGAGCGRDERLQTQTTEQTETHAMMPGVYLDVPAAWPVVEVSNSRLQHFDASLRAWLLGPNPAIGDETVPSDFIGCTLAELNARNVRSVLDYVSATQDADSLEVVDEITSFGARVGDAVRVQQAGPNGTHRVSIYIRTSDHLLRVSFFTAVDGGDLTLLERVATECEDVAASIREEY